MPQFSAPVDLNDQACRLFFPPPSIHDFVHIDFNNYKIDWHLFSGADIYRQMHEAPDMDLLEEYFQRNSEEAFATLVNRHVNLVYSAAFRKTGNAHAAQEVTQAVFIILAKKARSLRKETILSGWLYQTARLTATNFLRTEIRRAHREQEAYMQSLSNEPEPHLWPQIAPHLEDAMGQLGEKDRDAIALRFFEGKNFQEVGMAFGASENAAKKRVGRALEKLRKFFAKRGVVSTAAIIAGVVSANSVQAAPAGLATSIVVTAVKGSAVAASTLTLVEGTMKIMTWIKLKLALGIGAAGLMAVGAVTVVNSQTNDGSNLTPQEIAKKSEDAYARLSSYRAKGKVVAEGGDSITTTVFDIRLQRPNLYRVEWTQSGGLYTAKGKVWSDGNGDFYQYGADGGKPGENAGTPGGGFGGRDGKPAKRTDMKMNFAAAAGVSGLASSTLPSIFFKQSSGDALKLIALGRSKIEKENDEKIGGTDCFVISSTLESVELPDNRGTTGRTTKRFWIGKRDYLVHQAQTFTEGANIAPPKPKDSDLATILKRQNKPVTPEAIAALRTQLETMAVQARGKDYVFTETHEKISVNKKFARSDFSR